MAKKRSRKSIEAGKTYRRLSGQAGARAKEVRQLESRIERLRQERQRHTDELREVLEKLMTIPKEESAAWEAKERQTRGKISALNSEIAELEDQLKAKRADAREAEKKAEVAKGIWESLLTEEEREESKVSNEYRKAREKRLELEYKMLKQVRQSIAKSEESERTQEQEIEDLKAQVERLEDEAKGLRRDIEVLVEEAGEKKRKKVAGMIATLEKKAGKKKSKLLKLQSSLESTKSALEVLRVEEKLHDYNTQELEEELLRLGGM